MIITIIAISCYKKRKLRVHVNIWPCNCLSRILFNHKESNNNKKKISVTLDIFFLEYIGVIPSMKYKEATNVSVFQE